MEILVCWFYLFYLDSFYFYFCFVLLVFAFNSVFMGTIEGEYMLFRFRLLNPLSPSPAPIIAPPFSSNFSLLTPYFPLPVTFACVLGFSCINFEYLSINDDLYLYLIIKKQAVNI